MRSMLAVLAVAVLLPSLALAEGGRVVKAPAAGSPEEVILKFLGTGVDNQFETFYTTICHPDFCLEVPKDRADKQKYMWPRFQKFAESYFKDASRSSFEVTRTVPDPIDNATTEVKFFLKSTKRDNPTPVVLKKDKGLWKIFNSSL